jgi:hypothetical protein
VTHHAYNTVLVLAIIGGICYLYPTAGGDAFWLVAMVLCGSSGDKK